MRLISEKDGNKKRNINTVFLVPEFPKDMWYLYNLIKNGDKVSCKTTRKIRTESNSRSVSTSRFQTNIKIGVESSDFVNDRTGSRLILKGRTVEPNPYVKIGSYHSLDLELNNPFSLEKDVWDPADLDFINISCNEKRVTDVSMLLIQEGLAYIYLISPNDMIEQCKVEVKISKKYSEKMLEKFYDLVFQSMVKHVNFQDVKCILLASPGPTKDHFYKYMMDVVRKNDNKEILDNRAKFLLVHSSSVNKSAVKEILKNKVVLDRIGNISMSNETNAIELFHTMMRTEPEKTAYGFAYVKKASMKKAIKTLLITDDLLKCPDIEKRKKYAQIVDDVKAIGSTVITFVSTHPTGEQLSQLTGIAAILRFPLPEIGS